MNMVEKNNSWLHSDYKSIKNQFLTFGKSVKIDISGTSWRLPKRSKLKIFK